MTRNKQKQSKKQANLRGREKERHGVDRWRKVPKEITGMESEERGTDWCRSKGLEIRLLRYEVEFEINQQRQSWTNTTNSNLTNRLGKLPRSNLGSISRERDELNGYELNLGRNKQDEDELQLGLESRLSGSRGLGTLFLGENVYIYSYSLLLW